MVDIIVFGEVVPSVAENDYNLLGDSAIGDGFLDL
jgi:hypothetical protein